MTHHSTLHDAPITGILKVEWVCPHCAFDNYEEFSELPQMVICGSCGNEFDYERITDGLPRE